MVDKESERDEDATEAMEEEEGQAAVTVEPTTEDLEAWESRREKGMPSSKAEKELEVEEEIGECTCTHCGARGVPKQVKTMSGAKSYRCTHCGKFFKPQLEGKEGEAEKPVGAEAEEEKPLAPLEVEMTDRIKDLLPQYLPRIYGIPQGSKRIQAIIDTITPEQTSDPRNLHAHIKNFAPEADDRHLEAIIMKIYSTLESEGYIPPTGSPPYQPRYGRTSRRGYGTHYPGPSRQWPGSEGWSDEEESEGYPRKPKPVKIVVDGQTIETDIDGMMAWKRFKLEDDEAKRATKEHELRMKRLEAEITNIAKGSGGKEETVAVKIGDQTLHVPASVAPFILRGEDSEVKALKVTVDDLKEKVHDAETKLNEKATQELKDQLSGLYSKIEGLENRDPMEEIKKYDAYAEERGYSRTGKSTVDLLGELGDKADKRAQQLISKMGPKGEGEEGFTPEVTRSPQERQEMAGDIQAKLEKKERILEAENELLEAAKL